MPRIVCTVCFFVAALLGHPVFSQATATTPTFAEIPWGSSPAQVNAILLAKGYSPGAVQANGDLRFNTTVLDTPAAVYALFTPAHKLVKVSVMIATPDEDCFDTYETMKKQLTDKYGKPSLTLELYDAPYEKGDGYERTAVKIGKAHIATGWASGKAPDGDAYGLSINVTKELTVQIAYESSEWPTEADRRTKTATSDF